MTFCSRKAGMTSLCIFDAVKNTAQVFPVTELEKLHQNE